MTRIINRLTRRLTIDIEDVLFSRVRKHVGRSGGKSNR